MGKRILIVDDEEPMRFILALLLERAGYECHHVPNGVDALKLLDAGERFDLVTSDIVNYPWDGFTLREQMKRRYPDVPILMITTAPDLPYEHYLHKGNAEQVVEAVKRALGS